MTPEADKTAIRDAATVIVIRHMAAGPAVLMGQRGSNAAFMPDKFVFPGGAVDENDAAPPATGVSGVEFARLSQDSTRAPEALACAAVRELWEETGLILGTPGEWGDAPQGWRGFARTGHVPNTSALQFFFRAVTPPGRPRRFDARFFIAPADAIQNDPDDFSGAEDELAHLQWVPLSDARQFALPFITQVVLAELIGHVANGGPITTVPFFRNDDETHLITRLAGQSPL